MIFRCSTATSSIVLLLLSLTMTTDSRITNSSSFRYFLNKTVHACGWRYQQSTYCSLIQHQALLPWQRFLLLRSAKATLIHFWKFSRQDLLWWKSPSQILRSTYDGVRPKIRIKPPWSHTNSTDDRFHFDDFNVSSLPHCLGILEEIPRIALISLMSL